MECPVLVRHNGRLGSPTAIQGSHSHSTRPKQPRASAQLHRRALQNGTALQLAAYSILLHETPHGALPAVAYFVLKEQRLLTTDPARFGGGERIEGPEELEERERIPKRIRAAVSALERTLDEPH